MTAIKNVLLRTQWLHTKHIQVETLQWKDQLRSHFELWKRSAGRNANILKHDLTTSNTPHEKENLERRSCGLGPSLVPSQGIGWHWKYLSEHPLQRLARDIIKDKYFKQINTSLQALHRTKKSATTITPHRLHIMAQPNYFILSSCVTVWMDTHR